MQSRQAAGWASLGPEGFYEFTLWENDDPRRCRGLGKVWSERVFEEAFDERRNAELCEALNRHDSSTPYLTLMPVRNGR
jgi:hypothetical protein